MAAEKGATEKCCGEKHKTIGAQIFTFPLYCCRMKIQLLRGLDVPARVISFSALSAV